MVPADDVSLTGDRPLEGVFKVVAQVCEERNRPAPLPLIAVGLGAWNCDAISLPIDLLPFQRQHFRRAAHTIETMPTCSSERSVVTIHESSVTEVQS
jgi:hypothetical protein